LIVMDNAGSEAVIRRLSKSTDFVSGAELSNSLGITRAALWKRINSLRSRGFQIEGSRGRGYKLSGTPELSAEEIKLFVKGDLGREVVLLEKVDSTNDLAMDLALRGRPHGTVVIADSQSRGRGRLGRRWASPPGANIYMSVILRSEISPKDATLLTVASSVACALAVRKLSGLNAGIKWPNDIVVSRRKLGGILLEMRSEPDRVLFAVVGIGMNVNIRAGGLPPDVRPIATSILMETGRRLKRSLLIAGILDELDNELKTLKGEGAVPLLNKWRGLSVTIGKRVRVATSRETFTGDALDIDSEGLLIVKAEDGGLRTISSGDLSMLRDS
jgi:BirA family biotin operon repressor/biotin-[acetyl-CoA-carboxylase] ligase